MTVRSDAELRAELRKARGLPPEPKPATINLHVPLTVHQGSMRNEDLLERFKEHLEKRYESFKRAPIGVDGAREGRIWIDDTTGNPKWVQDINFKVPITGRVATTVILDDVILDGVTIPKAKVFYPQPDSGVFERRYMGEPMPAKELDAHTDLLSPHVPPERPKPWRSQITKKK